MGNDFLTVNDIQGLFHVSKPTAYRIMHNPACPRVCIGKRILVPREEFLGWVHTQSAENADLVDYEGGNADDL